MAYRIGVDIGGTFTDLILVDDLGTVFQIGKVLTTPADPAAGEECGTCSRRPARRRVR